MHNSLNFCVKCFLDLTFSFWTFFSCDNFFLKLLHLFVCLWVCVCVCGHAVVYVWGQRTYSVVSFHRMGHQAYLFLLSHLTGLLFILVSPVFRKLTFWAANDHASFTACYFGFSCICFVVSVSHFSRSTVSPARWTNGPMFIPLQILYCGLQCCFLSFLDVLSFKI